MLFPIFPENGNVRQGRYYGFRDCIVLFLCQCRIAVPLFFLCRLKSLHNDFCKAMAKINKRIAIR